MKKSAWKKSKFGRINAVDLLNSLALALGTAVPTFFGLINADAVIKDFKITIVQAAVATAIAFASTFCFDIVKRLGTNSSGQLRKEE